MYAVADPISRASAGISPCSERLFDRQGATKGR